MTNDATKGGAAGMAGMAGMGVARPAETATTDLTLEISRLSAASFAMAQIATERKDFAAHEADAHALGVRLDELRPRIDALPPDEQRVLLTALADAQLDLAYVRSAGDPPQLSARMHRFLHPDEPPE